MMHMPLMFYTVRRKEYEIYAYWLTRTHQTDQPGLWDHTLAYAHDLRQVPTIFDCSAFERLAQSSKKHSQATEPERRRWKKRKGGQKENKRDARSAEFAPAREKLHVMGYIPRRPPYAPSNFYGVERNDEE